MYVTVPLPPTGGALIVPVAPLTKLAETNVVFAGTVSVITNSVAFIFPVFVTVIVYVMLSPACTGSGLSVFVISSFGPEPTVVVSESETGETSSERTLAVLSIVVPFGRGEFVFTTS